MRRLSRVVPISELRLENGVIQAVLEECISILHFGGGGIGRVNCITVDANRADDGVNSADGTDHWKLNPEERFVRRASLRETSRSGHKAVSLLNRGGREVLPDDSFAADNHRSECLADRRVVREDYVCVLHGYLPW